MTAAGDPPSPPPRAGAPGLRWQGDGALARAYAPAPAPAGQAPVGSPPPGPGAEPRAARGVTLASVPRRAAGWLIDAAIKFVLIEVVLTLGGVGTVADPLSPSLLIAGQLLNRGYDWIFFTRGWTPGSRLLGMRIVRVENLGEPGPGRALVRVLGSVLSEAAFGIGYAWALWDRHRQTWQDKLARTYVVMSPPRDRR